MLSKLFGKRAQFDADDPAVRRAAIEELSPADCERFQDALADVAESDPDSAVRRAAIQRVIVLERLKALLDDPDAAVAKAIANRLADLSTNTPDLLNLPAVRDARIMSALEPAVVAPLIETVQASEHVLELAVASRSAGVRLSLARRLHTEASLVELEHRTRSRDKSVNRFARTRLEDIRHDQGHHAKALRRATQLVDDLEQLPSSDVPDRSRLGSQARSWTSNFERLEELGERLRLSGSTVPEIADLARRFALALDRAQQRAAEEQPIPESPAPAGSDFPALLDDLRRLDAELHGEALDLLDARESIHQRYADTCTRWSKASDHQPPPDDAADQYHILVHGFTQLFQVLDRLDGRRSELTTLVATLAAVESSESADNSALWQMQRKTEKASTALTAQLAALAWPEEFPQPKLLQDARSRQDAYAAFAKRCEHQAAELETRVRELIVQLEQQIEGGNLASALKCDAALRTTLRELPRDASEALSAPAHVLESKLQELKDWRNFATSPKRQALLDDMQSLIDSGLDPVDQADRIKALRASWNALGPVANQHDRRTYDQFNQAAERAFAPCRSFYEQQANEREFNLQQRQGICDALAQYLSATDWSAVDWKGAEQILRTARDEWRDFHPVDRAPGRKLKTRFDALTEELHGHIKTEWERNIVRKEELISSARQVVEAGTAVREATDTIKTLQQRWRTVGITPRRVDQRLWKSFRAACDAVFERRDQERDTHHEALDAEAESAEALCDEFAAHIDSTAPGSVSQETLRSFSRRFHQLGELPKAKAGVLTRRFDELERTYRSMLRDAAQLGLYATLDRWKALDECLADAEQRAVAGDPFDPPTPESFELGPTPGLSARLDQLVAGAPTRRPADDEGRQRMAIEAEILAGLESPAADQQRRLELQVERLNRGMSGQRDTEDPLDLAAQWCSLCSAASDDAALRERFFGALRRLAE